MKKIISLLLSAVIFLNLSLCIFADSIPPTSAGGIIGDQKDGYISYYYSLCPVFETDEDGNLFALAMGNTGTSATYRTGDMYDTGRFDDAFIHGKLEVDIDGQHYSLVVVVPPKGGELQYTGVTPMEQVDLNQNFDVFSFYHNNGNGGQHHRVILSDFDPETQIAEYIGFDDFMSSGISHPDTLAPVYCEDDTLLGFLINEHQMISVQGIENFMSDPNCFTIVNDIPAPEPEPEYEDYDYDDYDYDDYEPAVIGGNDFIFSSIIADLFLVALVIRLLFA